MLPVTANPLPNVPQQAAGVLALKLLAGDATAIPVGTVTRAAVVAVADGKAELQANGQSFTVRAQPALTPGTELAVRVSPAGIEAVVIPPTPTRANPTTAAPPAPVVVVSAPPTAPALAPAVAVQVATLAPARVSAAPVPPDAQPTSAAPATDGTVSPTSASVATPARPGTAIAPAPLPPAQPTVVAPNVPTRTATPAAQQQVPQLLGRPLAPTSPNARSASSGPATRATPGLARTPAPAAPQLSLVDVLTDTRNGKPVVRINGRPQVVADSAEPLTPGTRFVARVERTPEGARLFPVPPSDSPQLTTAVAAAVLKQDRPLPVAQALPLLVRELDAAPLPTSKPAVAEAVHEVREAATAILPDTPRPPTADELESLVEDGGQKYEGKLARQADGGDGPSPHDLKGALLKLLEVVPAVAHAQYPAAKAVLDGIEQQQAANVLAQQTNGPTVYQVPFPDGPQWKTLHLAVEQEPGRRAAYDDTSRPFRLLMHVPLSGLGDTWIDAGLNGEQFRAAVYLEQPAVRDRVRDQLPALRDELQNVGFTEVLLDVRPTADLTDTQRQRGKAMSAGVPVSTTVIDERA